MSSLASEDTFSQIQPAQVNSEFTIEHDLVSASSQSLGGYPAVLDTTAAFRKFGKAAINCIFSKIEWGRIDDRPACLICLDVSLSWTETYTLDQARLELLVNGGTSSQQKNETVPLVLPKISKLFGPQRALEGPRLPVERSNTNDLHGQIPTPIGSIETPSKTTQASWTDERQWRITVTREPAPVDREQRILRCRMQGNARSQITFPDIFRLGLIVEHGGNPFTIRFGLQGSVAGIANAAVLIGDAFTFGPNRKLSRLEFSFEPESSTQALTEGLLSEHLGKTNGKYHQ